MSLMIINVFVFFTSLFLGKGSGGGMTNMFSDSSVLMGRESWELCLRVRYTTGTHGLFFFFFLEEASSYFYWAIGIRGGCRPLKSTGRHGPF